MGFCSEIRYSEDFQEILHFLNVHCSIENCCRITLICRKDDDVRIDVEILLAAGAMLVVLKIVATFCLISSAVMSGICEMAVFTWVIIVSVLGNDLGIMEQLKPLDKMLLVASSEGSENGGYILYQIRFGQMFSVASNSLTSEALYTTEGAVGIRFLFLWRISNFFS